MILARYIAKRFALSLATTFAGVFLLFQRHYLMRNCCSLVNFSHLQAQRNETVHENKGKYQQLRV